MTRNRVTSSPDCALYVRHVAQQLTRGITADTYRPQHRLHRGRGLRPEELLLHARLVVAHVVHALAAVHKPEHKNINNAEKIFRLSDDLLTR